jgi:peptide/nickel transport system permease protein
MSAASWDEPVEGAEALQSLRIPYWQIVWEQLRKNPLAIFGLWCIGAFVVAAVYAPLLSFDQPLLWVDEAGLSSPWLRSLFNRLAFENAVDIFFNLAMVASPFYLAVVVWLRRRLGQRFRSERGRIIGALVALHFVAFGLIAPQSWGPFDNPFYFTERVRDHSSEARASARFAVFPLREHDYRATDPTHSVAPPSATHWLGADKEGRDVLARMIYGTRVSLTIGVVAVSIYVVIGVVLGALAGYFAGWVDMLVSRAIEVMICFPSFFLILTLAAFVEDRSIFHVMVIIGITSWPGVARLIRAEFLKHKGLDYAQAALALGVSRQRIIFRHILPNAIAPALVAATFGVASAVLTESSLAFLGLGDVTVASWGGILSSGRVEQKLWLILVPGFAIFALVSVFNLVGEGLRDALDPKLRS